jgi:hypothetical protein
MTAEQTPLRFRLLTEFDPKPTAQRVRSSNMGERPSRIPSPISLTEALPSRDDPLPAALIGAGDSPPA